MTLHRFEDIERDKQTQAVIPGAEIFVYLRDGATLATLYDDSSALLANPVVSNTFGVYYYNVLDPDIYIQRHRYNGVDQLYDFAVIDITLEEAFRGAVGPEGPPGPPGYKLFATYAALAATTGTANEAAWVTGADAGTHIDPVVGGTVDNVGVYAYSLSPAGWRRISDTSGTAQTFVSLYNGSTAQTEWIWTPPQSAINSEGGYDNAPYSWRTTINYIANYGDGKFGTDYVGAWGFNIGPALFPLTAGLPAVMYKMESKFRYNRFGTYVTQCEIHVGATVTADVVPYEFRPISIGAPHLKADWANLSSMAIQNAYISWADGSLAATEWMAWDARASLGGSRFITTTNVLFRENTNNIPIHNQQNSAGSGLISLPYVNATNAYQFSRDIFGQIGTPVANPVTGVQGYITLQGAGTLATGAICIYLATPVVTGSAQAFLFDGNASTLFSSEVKNNHATGAARLDVTAVAGAASVQLTSNSVAVNITWNGAVLTIAKPVKQTPVAVAALPAAATAGAGARYFVSDANATTFNSVVAGGGANVVPVFSDATNWRIG